MNAVNDSRNGCNTTFAQPGDWHEHAACKGQTHLVALPTTSRGDWTKDLYRRIAEARQLCHSCPVHTDCLAWALTTPDPAQGMIAGGYTPKERKRIRDGADRIIRKPGGPRQHRKAM